METNQNALYLVKVEAGANNNKYYRMIPIGDSFKVEYGRIGSTGFQTSSYSMRQWDKKLKEKLKKGYVDQTRLVAETTVKQKHKKYLDISNPSIASIVARLQAMAQRAIEDNYTVSSNKVTEIMISEAQLILNSLMSTETIESFNSLLIELFRTIPRKMSRVGDYLAKSKNDFAEIIQREQDLLDVMGGQVVTKEVVKEDEDNNPAVNKTILEVMGLEFYDITNNDKDLIKKNLGGISDRYFQAWKVINLKTQARFNNFIKDNNIQDTRLLWHGSRNENFWSILNSGLVLRPNAVITGKMFGHGIYYAPKAQKSLGYTSLQGSYWAGGNANSGFMMLNEVAYGSPYNVYSFDNKYSNLDYNRLQKMSGGANCLHAHSGNGMLRNDEIIVYKEDQCTVKYLVELK